MVDRLKMAKQEQKIANEDVKAILESSQLSQKSWKLMPDAILGLNPVTNDTALMLTFNPKRIPANRPDLVEKALQNTFADAMSFPEFKGRFAFTCSYNAAESKSTGKSIYNIERVEPILKNSIKEIKAKIDESGNYTATIKASKDPRVMNSIGRLISFYLKQEGVNVDVIPTESSKGEEASIVFSRVQPPFQFILLEAPTATTPQEQAKLRMEQTNTLMSQLSSDLLKSATAQINISQASEENKMKALEAITFANDNFAKAEKSEVARYKVIFAFMSALRFMDDDPKVSASGNELLNKAKTLDKPIYAEWFERREEFNTLMQRYNERALKTTKLVQRKEPEIELAGGLQLSTTPYTTAGEQTAELPQRADEAKSKKELQAILDEQKRVNQNLLSALKEGDRGTIMAIQGKLLFLQTKISKMTADELKDMKKEVVALTEENKKIVEEGKKREFVIDAFTLTQKMGVYNQYASAQINGTGPNREIGVKDVLKFFAKVQGFNFDRMEKELGRDVTEEDMLRSYATKVGVNFDSLKEKVQHNVVTFQDIQTAKKSKGGAKASTVVKKEEPKAPAAPEKRISFALEGVAPSRVEKPTAAFTKQKIDTYFEWAFNKGEYLYTPAKFEELEAVFNFIKINYTGTSKETTYVVAGKSINKKYAAADFNVSVDSGKGSVSIKKVSR